MSLPISVQLYSIREAMAQDFEGSVRRIAEMGYAGVETAGFPGTTPAAAAQLFNDLGLTVSSAHAPLPLGERQNEILDTMDSLGCKHLICPALPKEDYKTVAGVQRLCDMLNEANAVATARGLSLGVHNHWWEFEPVEDTRPYQIWLERLEPTIFFELDVYWIKTAGLDPATIVKEFGARAPFLHMKDGPATTEEAMVAFGEGVMDLPAVIEAGQGATEWYVVELDKCDTDMFEAVEKSFNYLVQGGWGHGK